MSGRRHGQILTTFQGWWMVGVLLIFYAMSTIDRFVLAVVIDDVKGDLNLSDFEMGIVLGPAIGISYALCGLLFGWAADKFSRRHVIFFGIMIWSLATVGSGFAPDFKLLFLARVCVGIGEAALLPAAYSLIADGIPRHRITTAMSILGTAPKFGQAVTYALVGILLILFSRLLDDGMHLGGLVPWELTFVSLGILGLALAPLLFTFPEPAPSAGAANVEKDTSKNLFEFLSGKNAGLIFMLLAGTVIMSLVATANYNWAPAFVGRSFHYTSVQYGPPMGILSLVAAAVMVCHGRVVDFLLLRWDIRDIHIRYYTWLLGASIPLAFGLFFIPHAWAFFLSFCLFQILALPFVMFVMTTVGLIVPSPFRAQVAACFVFCSTFIGGGLSPVIVGALTDFVFQDPAKIGYSLAIVTGTGCVSSFILFRLALRPLNRLLSGGSERDS